MKKTGKSTGTTAAAGKKALFVREDWRAEEGGRKVFAGRGYDRPVCEVCDHDAPRGKKNRRLIAASPVLLRAHRENLAVLEEALATQAICFSEKKLVEAVRKGVELSRTAISAAERLYDRSLE